MCPETKSRETKQTLLFHLASGPVIKCVLPSAVEKRLITNDNSEFLNSIARNLISPKSMKTTSSPLSLRPSSETVNKPRRNNGGVKFWGENCVLSRGFLSREAQGTVRKKHYP